MTSAPTTHGPNQPAASSTGQHQQMPLAALLPLLRLALLKLTLRYSGGMAIYEEPLQLERWNSSIVELCMCALLVPSFVMMTDADADTRYFPSAIFMLQSMLAAMAVSRRLCWFGDGLQGKRIFESAVASTAVGGVFVHAMAASRAEMEPQCGCSSSQFGPAGLSTMATVAVIVTHVLHFGPLVKLLVSLSLPLCAIISPAFPFGPGPVLKLLVMATLLGYVFGYALESVLRSNFLAQHLVQTTCEAQRRADSRLNHVIKGLCGGATGILQGVKLELLQQGIMGDTCDSLDEVRRMLQAATEWVHKRQFFLQLESGEYSSSPVQCNLQDRMETLLGPDGIYDGVVDVCVDINVAELVAQEALSNARKYGNREHPIHITSEIQRDCHDKPKILMTISNVNKPGLRRLSDEECKDVFRPGSKASGASSTSDGIGLDNASVAVRAALGRIWLSTSSTPLGHKTNLHCELPLGDMLSARSPVCVMHAHDDASDMKRERQARGIERRRRSACEQSHAMKPGSEVFKDNGRNQAANGSNVSGEVAPTEVAPLVCLGLDDTLMLRKMHVLLFKLFMGADMKRSGSLGATREEITHFVDVVMGRRDLSLLPAQLTPADVVLIDQNLSDDDDELERGEDIALRLRKERFCGVICVLTGSNTEEIERLSRLPHVDLVCEKSTDLRQLSQLLSERARPLSVPFSVVATESHDLDTTRAT